MLHTSLVAMAHGEKFSSRSRLIFIYYCLHATCKEHTSEYDLLEVKLGTANSTWMPVAFTFQQDRDRFCLRWCG